MARKEEVTKAGVRRILFALSQGEKTATELASQFGVSYYTIAHHLHKLLRFKQVSCNPIQTSIPTRRISGLDGTRVHIPVLRKRWVITERGLGRLGYLIKRDADEAEAEVQQRTGRREITIEGLFDGPVGLMKIPEPDTLEQVTNRVPARDLIVEPKYDGWAIQVVGGRLYSRRGTDLSDNFPVVTGDLQDISQGNHLIGELVWWEIDPKSPTGFMQNVRLVGSMANTDPDNATRIAATSKGYAQAILFDILGHREEDISEFSWTERRKILERVVGGREGRHVGLVKSYPFDDWPDVSADSVSTGGEGVVIKNVKAPYAYGATPDEEPSARDTWWKWKVGLKTDDFIVYKIETGPKGRVLLVLGQVRGNQLYHVGRVNNLSAVNEAEARQRSKKKGAFLVEVAFQDRTPSGSLRIPRFVRFRDDKDLMSAVLPEKFVNVAEQVEA